MAVLMMVVVHFMAVKRNMPREDPVPLREWPVSAIWFVFTIGSVWR